MQIRRAEETDIPALLPLMRDLAEFEKYLDVFAITEDVVREQGFRRTPPDFSCLVAQGDDGELVGMAVYHLIPYTAVARPTLYVKELFVAPAARNMGIGEALMRGVARDAVRHGCGAIKWQVARWNADSMRFYERLGATQDHTWVDYALSPGAFAALAGSSPADAGIGAAAPAGPRGAEVVTDLNPQATQMADESMVRNLDAQARAIWPQELPLIRRYALPGDPRILDAGCGTGEAASRLAELFPRARVLGVDIVDAHLDLARSRYASLASRLTFEHQSIYALPVADGTFDLTVCRHVLHSIPHADRVIAELARVTRRGGYLHLIPEDYGMLHFQRGALDPGVFWYQVPASFGAATHTDLFIGRNTYGILAGLNLEDITVDYIIVDTARVPRETFATILEAWRDGYAESIGELTPIPREAAVAYFDQMIANIRDRHGYAAWMVPVVSARVPLAESR